MPPILPGRSILSQYAGLGEPFSADSGFVPATATPIAYNASPVTKTFTIPTDGTSGIQPKCSRGKWRLRISGVTVGTTIGLIKITVDDGTYTCVVDSRVSPAIAGAQVDMQGEIPPIDNASNNGGTNDLMPTNIVNVNAIIAFTTSDGSGNSIADACLEFYGNP